MKTGTRYVVKKESADGTFDVGDHIWLNADGSISCMEACGWIDVADVEEATAGMEIEIDKKWIERQEKKLRELLA